MTDFDLELLDFCDKRNIEDYLSWVVDLENKTVNWYLRCNDIFHWGCSDAEKVTADTLPHLRAAFSDIEAIANPGRFWTEDAIYLWVARVRGMRPQGAAYPKDRALWPLFDACGPERETGLGNPHTPESYHARCVEKEEVDDVDCREKH